MNIELESIHGCFIFAKHHEGKPVKSAYKGVAKCIWLLSVVRTIVKKCLFAKYDWIRTPDKRGY